MNGPKKTLKGNLAASQGELSGSSSLRSDGSWESQMEAWPHESPPKAFKAKQAWGAIRLESTQIRWFM